MPIGSNLDETETRPRCPKGGPKAAVPLNTGPYAGHRVRVTYLGNPPLQSRATNDRPTTELPLYGARLGLVQTQGIKSRHHPIAPVWLIEALLMNLMDAMCSR